MKNLMGVLGAAIVALGSWCAVGAAVTPTDYAKKIEIALSDDAKTALGENTLTDFPLPVRLSTAIENFSYADFQCAGEDIVFADADGNALAFELDTWDTSGASLYWVKITSLTTNTTLTVYYGADTATTHTPSDVWTKYVAVIHGGAVPADSSPANLAVTTNAVTGVTTNGFLGTSLNKADYNTVGLNIANPRNALTSSGSFSVSAWYRLDGTGGNNDNNFILASTRSGWSTADGFMMNQEKGNYVSVSKKGAHLWSSGSKLTVGTWGQVSFAYQSGTSATAYLNGVQYQQSTSPGTLESTGTYWTFGSYMNTASKDSMRGDMDEIRVYDGVASSAWFAAEYGFAANAAWVSAGAAEATDSELVRFAAAPTLTSTADGLRVSVTLHEDSHAGAVYAICGAAQPYSYKSVISELAQPGETVSGLITNMPADVVCGFGVLGVSSADASKTTTKAGAGTFCGGAISIAKGEDADEEFLDVPGTFTVTRPAGATTGDLVVNYAASGTAVAGTHYQALPGSVTIPDGETSATINVYPLAACTVDHTLTLTIAPGLYASSDSSASITIKKFDPTTGFEKKVEFTVSGYTGATLANFPVLVKISESAIDGFSYADCHLANGGDIRFITEGGAQLASEVAVWNPEGESIFWVKVPSLASETKIKMIYGSDDPWSANPTSVWSDYYLGVWHFDEIADGSTPDSTGNDLAMAAYKPTIQVVAADGQIGNALVNATAAGGSNGGFLSPTYTDKFTSSQFTISGWFNRLGHAMNGYERFFSAKSAYNTSDGFEMENNNGSTTKNTMRGSAGDAVSLTTYDQSKAGWHKYTLVYNGSKLTAYVDGVAKVTDAVVTTVKHSLGFSVGNNSARNERAFWGNIDEVRFAKSCESADWVAAEYAFETGTATFTNEGSSPIDSTAIKFDGKATVTKESGVFKLSATTSDESGTGTITAKYGTLDAYDLSAEMTSSAAVSTTYKVAMTGLAADTSYKARAEGVNAKGTISKAVAPSAFYNGNLTIAAGDDADEKALTTPGTIIVSRADTYGDLVVNYTPGGTAVSNVNYVALSGSITIPNGSTSATIEVYPLRAKTEDHTLTITLADGLYFVNDSAKAATITIKKLTAPAGWNTWIADADGKASVAANWSDGVPKATDKVLFDGRYSTANCEWDADASHTVAAWSQASDYTGTVQIDTTYDDTFPALNVTGDVEILGGGWTHKINLSADGQKYHLKAIVGGSFNLASGLVISGEMKGYWAQKFPADSTYSAHAASGDGYQYVYGNVYKPADLGAGSYSSGSTSDNKSGGGAVWIEVGGALTLNGTINVRGRQFDGSNTACGSVYLKAASCSGSGSILANYAATGYYNGNRGAGGRVAIELTTATTLGLPVANVKINGVCSGGSGGGGGTFYLKTADPEKPNGTLYLDDVRSKSYGARWLHWKAITAIPAGETWTFDEIVISNYGRLLVPAGTTLNLPNGPQSVSASSTRLGGIVVNGGTVNWGDRSTYEFSGKWVFQAMQNYTFNGDVVVKKDGALGAMCFLGAANLTDFAGCNITVNGDLTVETGGYLFGTGCGPDITLGRTPYASHGGQTGTRTANEAYDSIFNPQLPGYTICHSSTDQAASSPGGAMLKFVISGDFVNNGTVNVSGITTSNAGSSGGTINITAATYSGSGTISANSATGSDSTGGGGRIAVKLTDQSVGAGLIENCFAKGVTTIESQKAKNTSSSAGTVYLQGSDNSDKGGTIYVRNDGNYYTNAFTRIPAGVTRAGVAPDVADDFKHANLYLGDCGRVLLAETLKLKVLTQETDTLLNLNGETLTVTRAVLNGTKLSAGTYTSESAAVAGFITGEGSLVVKPDGMAIFLR